jgi:hypothetical protein
MECQIRIGDADADPQQWVGAISLLPGTHYPSAQVPYEILNKKFRSGQKVIDREANHVASCLAEVDRLFTGQEGAEEKAAMLRQLDSLKQQLQQLKVGGQLDSLKQQLHQLKVGGQLDSLKQQLHQLKVGGRGEGRHAAAAGQPQAAAAPAQGRRPRKRPPCCDSWTASSSSCTSLR